MTEGPTRRAAMIGGLLVVAGAGAIAAQPRSFERRRLQIPLDTLIPRAIGGWHVDGTTGLILPEADTLDETLYDDQLSRNYAGPGLPAMMLLIAHGVGGFATGVGVHRPETCYPAAGFTISATRDIILPVAAKARVPARFLTAVRSERQEQIGYWRRISNDFPVSARQEQMLILRRNLVGVIPDGVLVRISTVDPDRDRAGEAIARFATALISACGAEARQILLGGPTAAAAGAPAAAPPP